MATTVTYTYERKFGTQGSGDGQFLNPHDISFDASGNLFVCDRDRNDVQKFTNGGTFISKFGGSGSGNGQFDVPYSIQHDPTYAFIYVCDRGNNRVQKLDSTGTWISNITTVNGQALNAPEDITFDKTNGDMYITDTGNNRVVKLDSSHAFIRQWGSFGNGNGMFDHPHSINTDAVRNVYVSCGNQPYIQKFNKDGHFIKKWGTEGTGQGQTQMFLEHMDIDKFGRVHLINNDSRPIVNVWDLEGTWITQYGKTSSGSANGQFKEPEHVTCDPSTGNPFVVDCKNFRIQVFSVSSSGSSTPVQSTSIRMMLTGGSSNTDPNLSLGGNVSTTEVVSDNVHNLFRRITDSEASSGVTIHRCVAIKNADAISTMRNAVFYMVQDTQSIGDLALYSKAQAAKNVVETATVDEFTTPTGANINFIATLNRSGGLQLGDLAPGEFINVWMRVIVNPGSLPFTENFFRVRVEINGDGTSGPPDPDTGGGGGPTPPPDPDTGVNFTMAALGDTSCSSDFTKNLNKIKARKASFVVFNGDNAYSAGEKCFIDACNNAGYGKTKSTISFGNHDVDEGSDANGSVNALKSAWSLSKTYFKRTFNNVGIIVMEGGENESVSSSSGGTQYNAVKQFLIDLKNTASIEWIFVFNHYPIYGPSSDHGNDAGVRDAYDPLFDTYGVDIVVTSHNHNMWHSKLLKYNSGSPGSPTASGTDPNYSYNRATTNHGKLYIGSGAGGRSHYGINSVPSYVQYSNDSKYGYLFMVFSDNGKKITFKFYDNADNLLKTFTLSHT